ncbi:Acetyltransferase (GNAT) domain-containing protein [Andreprevotia lacus DSM 23236]|jgi:ribosomal protein S18 acetylase RimI-like enzyme|uniref:Acetyltransferase (GNAT) domain-containing protein n=1 Tax=Andreprevotia lacus DSM 23236 TaxID=1121001 RepID=A0A1W1X9V5_9NEIS|nr:GNAT family N-acetyltransferase [Andreprevotia lacus]SMC20311.1 Acetyltransferase (GNAT) domain-containing protein [Andreprevotia lacus DSM 23236]
MTLTLRAARASDATMLSALACQVWLHTYASSGISPAIAAYLHDTFAAPRFIERLADPQQLLTVAMQEDHLLGYAQLHTASPCRAAPDLPVELQTLYILKHASGRGIGRQLLLLASTQAGQHSATPLWLSVNAANARAITFYQRNGLQQIGEYDFLLGGQHYPNLLLAGSPAMPAHPQRPTHTGFEA